MSTQPRAGGRAFARAFVTAGFVVFLLVAAGMGALARSHMGRPRSHHYPRDPVPLERAHVSGAAPRAPRATTLDRPVRIASLRGLAALLPEGALRPVGSQVWRLTRPVDLTRGATLALDGVSLELSPGSFLQARDGGSLLLTRSTVAAVDARGAPAREPAPARGFLAARDGGRLVLRGDTLENLGHLATVSYGVSLRDPAAGCVIAGTTIEGNYIGIFLSHAHGVSIVGNRVLDSRVYGIDPYGTSHDLLIERNYVARSGLHGIVLANHVSRTRVLANEIVGSRVHGIVLVDHANGNVVRGNHVVDAFDGVAVTASSHNDVLDNTIESAARFGLRVSGASSANVFSHNRIAHALLGAYFYSGATANVLLDTSFSANRENVRIRADAPANHVRPTPRLSELR